jgi:hypothetical protein
MTWMIGEDGLDDAKYTYSNSSDVVWGIFPEFFGKCDQFFKSIFFSNKLNAGTGKD